MIDVHYASLTSHEVQHRIFNQMVTHPDIHPVQQGLTAVNRREPVFPFGDGRTLLKRGCVWQTHGSEKRKVTYSAG